MEQPDFSLAGQVALVTGSSRGIGHDLVLALVGAGATVGIAATNAVTTGNRLQWSRNAPVLRNNSAIQLTPPASAAPLDVTASIKVTAMEMISVPEIAEGAFATASGAGAAGVGCVSRMFVGVSISPPNLGSVKNAATLVSDDCNGGAENFVDG